MFCFSCGQELPEAARFCSNCGTNLRGIEVRPSNDVIIGTTNIEEKPEQQSGSLPFEFDIIEHFREKLPDEYIHHVHERLKDAAEDPKIKLNTYIHISILDISSIKTVGDLAFYFKKLNDHHSSIKPTTQMLMELLARVYLKS